MKKFIHTGPRTKRVVIVLTLLLVVITVLTVMVTFGKPMESLWHAYYTLLLPVTADRAELGEQFESISSLTTTVPLCVGITSTDVAIDALSERLEQFDPRNNPFLTHVGNLFKADVDGKPYNIVYIKKDRRFRSIKTWLHDHYGKSFIILENPNNFPYIQLVFFILLSVSLAIIFSDYLFLRIMISLLLCGFSLTRHASIYYVFLFQNVLIQYGLHLIIQFVKNWIMGGRRAVPDSGFYYLMGALILAFGYGMVMTIPDSIFGFYLFYFISFCSIIILSAIIYVFVKYDGCDRPEHTYFFFDTFYIFQETEKKFGLKEFWMVLLLLIIPFIPTRNGLSGRDIQLPLPENSVESVEQLSLGNSNDPDFVPGLGDYFAHLAQTDGFLENYPYQLPKVGKQTTLYEFYLNDEDMIVPKITAKEFTGAWYDDIMSNVKQNDILSFYLSQGIIDKIERKGIGNIGTERPSLWVLYPLAVFFCVFWFISRIQSSYKQHRKSKSELIRRRVRTA